MYKCIIVKIIKINKKNFNNKKKKINSSSDNKNNTKSYIKDTNNENNYNKKNITIKNTNKRGDDGENEEDKQHSFNWSILVFLFLYWLSYTQ